MAGGALWLTLLGGCCWALVVSLPRGGDVPIPPYNTKDKHHRLHAKHKATNASDLAAQPKFNDIWDDVITEARDEANDDLVVSHNDASSGLPHILDDLDDLGSSQRDFQDGRRRPVNPMFDPAQDDDLDLDGPDLDFGVRDGESELEWRRQVTGLLRGVSEQVNGLQHTMINLKLQNHLLYKQLKRWQNRCGGQIPAGDVPPVIQSAAMTMDKPACPVDYFLRKDNNMCYRFVADRITWRMARERCRAQDADLVTIDSGDTQRWVSTEARKRADTRHCNFWTGGEDRTSEGQWRWARTGQLFAYHNWNHNEPNNGRGDEHCLQMLWVFGWKWNDARCNHESACYVCEAPPQG